MPLLELFIDVTYDMKIMMLWRKLIVGVLVTSSRATLTKVAADFPGTCLPNKPAFTGKKFIKAAAAGTNLTVNYYGVCHG